MVFHRSVESEVFYFRTVHSSTIVRPILTFTLSPVIVSFPSFRSLFCTTLCHCVLISPRVKCYSVIIQLLVNTNKIDPWRGLSNILPRWEGSSLFPTPRIHGPRAKNKKPQDKDATNSKWSTPRSNTFTRGGQVSLSTKGDDSLPQNELNFAPSLRTILIS